MNVLIICFSQTGNTQKLADRILKGIIDSGNRCSTIGMKQANIDEIPNYDLIGIGTPTFFYREPVNVRTFIKKMPKGNGRHCFLLCSHGSIMGNTLYYMQEQLKEKEYVVIGAFDSYADASLQFYPKVWHTAGHPDEIELSEAEQFGRGICNVSTRIQNGESDLILEFQLIEDTWWAEASKRTAPESLRQVFPKFSINQDKCTQCLICQENCPVDAIHMEADPPEIQKEGCIFCLYCEKACPEEAIEADWTLIKKVTRGNLKKYVTVLKDAEKEGKFRPHVDYEKII